MMKMENPKYESSYAKVIIVIIAWLLWLLSVCSLAFNVFVALYLHQVPIARFFEVLNMVAEQHKFANALFLPALLYGIVKEKLKLCVPWAAYGIVALPPLLYSVWVLIKIFANPPEEYNYGLTRNDLKMMITVNFGVFIIYASMLALLASHYDHLKKSEKPPKEIVPLFPEHFIPPSVSDEKINICFANEKGITSEC